MADTPRTPGEEGYSFEDDPQRVQGAQPHTLEPLRVVPDEAAQQFPSPHIQIDAQIGDARRRL